MIVYSSTDSGAPVLTNANGSLIALLTAVLVNGYGSKAGAGWTRPFTGTNLAVFQQGSGGNGRFLRVFDGGNQDDGQQRAAKLRGYQSMTAVSTGTGPFPTTGQRAGNGMNFGYQSVNQTSATPWIVYASSSFFWVFTDAYSDSGTTYWQGFAFGTFNSEKSGDTFNQILLASPSDNGSWPAYTGDSVFTAYVERSDTGTGGAVPGGFQIDSDGSGYIGGGSDKYPYPHRPAPALLMDRPILRADGYVRGTLPGLWYSLHVAVSIGPDGTTWSGATGALAGKNFRFFRAIDGFYTGGASIVMETSNTW